MPRNCNCVSGCGSEGDDIQFEPIAFVGSLEAKKEWADWISEQGDPVEIAAWKKALHGQSVPRKYSSDKHTDARMHLGGIGAGNFEIGADGQFTTWQLFNTLRDGYVPFFFAVKCGKTAKLLQTRGGPDVPRIKQIEMTGDYPIASLKFIDPDLPVHVEMEAFSPFAPLDSRLSSMPVACFIFKVHNPTNEKQTVSLAAMMQNPVGYDAMGVPISFNSVGFNEVAPSLSNQHPNFGGNTNEIFRVGKAAGLIMSGGPAPEPTLDKPLRVFTNLPVAVLNAAPLDRPKNLDIQPLSQLVESKSKPSGEGTVIWLEEPGDEITETILTAARDAVKAGATLIFSGKKMPLLENFAKITQGKPLDKSKLRPDIVFEDFESGYGKWKVEGTAFGKKPASGTLPSQQRVSGFLGKGLVNTYLGGDESLGKLASEAFTIERSYIRFLVGGGGYQKETAIRLVLDGKIVRSTSGKNDERLEPAHWDVREFTGKKAHIEIVDDAKGGWGHINVDQIEFVDLPSGVGVLELLEELLPVRFSGMGASQRTGLTGVTLKNGSRGAVTLVNQPVFSLTIGNGRVDLVSGAILEHDHIELTGARQLAYAVLCSMAEANYVKEVGVSASAAGFGELSLVTHGSNFTEVHSGDDWKGLFDAIAVRGQFESTPERGKVSMPSLTGSTITGAIASKRDVRPGETIEVAFLLAWRYPNKYNRAGVNFGNHYCKEWPSVQAVVKEASANLDSNREKTLRFRATLYDSTLPNWLLDALSSQMAIIRHVGVVFRAENGDVYGWEGSNGCCDPTCTHVWGYEQTLARVFPDLEKEMRRIDYKHQQRADGGINNRTEFPSPPKPTGEQPFTDGHASCILKAYREALNHPDDTWMREYWPDIKKAVQYLLGRDVGGKDKRGLLADEQWNTYDDAIHGVNSFIGSYYLAALRAGEEMAIRMGDLAFSGFCRETFERGKRNLVAQCWNGEYFFQNLPDAEQRWGEYGKGCLSDQLIGQWWAHQLGLGYVLPKEHVQKAMKSIFNYNWLPDMSNWKHNQRKFAGGKDKGLLVCTWPNGGRPANPLPYVDEVWTGVEYQVAAHMIYEGMVDEGFAIVKGLRDRYDGVPRAPMPRNPWNEIECGGHYARAMSSWSLLLALSGYEYDGPAKALRFTPRYTPANFKSFFIGPEGWGSLIQTRTGDRQRNQIVVAEGAFKVDQLHLDPAKPPRRINVTVGRAVVPATLKPRMDGVTVALNQSIRLTRGQTLSITLT